MHGRYDIMMKLVFFNQPELILLVIEFTASRGESFATNSFYRELDLKLDEIKEILEQPDFNVEQALYEHQQKLLEKRNEIDRL